MNSETQNKAHPATLLPLLLLALWFISQTAKAADFTIPGLQLPIITSYATPSGFTGERVFANIQFVEQRVGSLTISAKPVIPDRIEFPSVGGRRAVVPVTSETPGLISFVIPAGAITGNPALLGRDGLRRENQPRFQVVTSAQLTRGVTFINRTQYLAASMKRGTVELLPRGSTGIPTGQALFIPMTLSVTPSALDVSLVRVTSAGARVPMFNLRETVGGPVSGTRLPAFRAVQVMDRLTVAEALGAVNQTAEWVIRHRGQNRLMKVTSNGAAILEDRRLTGSLISKTYQLEEVSWPDNAASVRFTLREGANRVGETIVLHPPFDSFAANRLGHFTLNDGPFDDMILISGNLEVDAVTEVVPMLARRVR
jgi:hypothetical protein